MKNFIKNCIAFVLVGLVLAEIIARLFFLTSDIPRRTIDDAGIQKYFPNQDGHWVGGTHKWQINEMGWPGPMPKSMDNLVTLIGDSFIENFMNPEECHQASFLQKKLPKHNYLEVSRSGVSFIEAMEIAKQMDSLRPQYQIIYAYDSDFDESIKQIRPSSQITQIDLENQKVIHGKLKSPGIKNILYNWKFAFYLYSNFKRGAKNKKGQDVPQKTNEADDKNKIDLYRKLLKFVVENYKIEDKILVFRPETNPKIIDLAHNFGFKTLSLQVKKGENWTFDHDKHWSCFGHEKAADQIMEFLK
ncbi:hypothetical protein [Spongiimicrobium salis]|uniref:hypothetical protein n=1 Tax=Spongiimicrobium salis TaxID=1667022 RepID=UPI00374DCBB8